MDRTVADRTILSTIREYNNTCQSDNRPQKETGTIGATDRLKTTIIMIIIIIII